MTDLINIEPDIQSIHPDFLQSRTFVTKNLQPIDFKLFYLDKEPALNGEASFNLCAVQALVNNEPAAYISDNIKNQFFNNSLEFYIFQSGTKAMQEAYQQNNLEVLIPLLYNKLGFGDLILDNTKDNSKIYKKNLKFLTKYIEEERGSEYHSFINYWHNRPNVEMMCVYNEKDKNYKVFDSYPFMSEARPKKNEQLTNFRGQGISQALYEVAGLWMQSKNMHVHASTTQSEDGKKMWNILENHPKFQVLLDSYMSRPTTNRKQLQEKERKKINVL
jgi:hypothetical protein